MRSGFARSPGFPRLRLDRGFTLTELLITLVVLAIVVVVLTVVMYTAAHNKTAIASRLEASQAARVAVDMMARDLRSAGYGADVDYGALPQPPIAYVDSLQVLINANFIGDNGVRDTVAYNPAGDPKPAPLAGTSPWAPPIKYRTGAEVVRWTLDADNNGVVDAADLLDDNAIDAQRTRNPSDFELLRQVYGDSTNDEAGNNGGVTERVALIRRPTTGGVPPMFTVYLKGIATPWDWSAGPVPANQLQDIERLVINVVAPAGKPDRNGNYPEVQLNAQVNSLRNVPSFGLKTFVVDGFVYDDVNKNHVKDGTEGGLAGSVVRLGSSYSTSTDGTGHFLFRALGGSYTLKHVPLPSYGTFNSPDSFLVTVGPGTTRSFGDTARAGGWVSCSVYEDLNDSHTFDTGEPPIRNTKLTFSPGGATAFTNGSGSAVFFAQTGGWSIAATPPDSFIANSTNPVSGTMTTGGSASISFALKKNDKGTVQGTVYRDNNRNGVLEAGETGMGSVWVGVTNDGGTTILGFAYTDSAGRYSIDVPVNDPPHTTAYSVMVVPPAGFYPTSTTSIGGVWVTVGSTVSNQNFGMGTFSIITLSASRVLSLASRDLIEKDWNGSHTENAVKDADLVLGADAGGTDNVSVWFNQYNATPLFPTNPDYTRLAPNSVLSMVLDTLDANDEKERPDLVTGTKYTASGNFFVWYNQGSGGNHGYFPSTYNAGRNYTTANNGDVQALLALDCAGGSELDLIVGSKSATAGQGSVEIWQSDNATTPAFTRVETYPPAGPLGAGTMGEVTCMALADFDGDGRKDLVIGTRLSDYTGQLIFLKNVSKTTGIRFVYQVSYALADQTPLSLACTDVNGDGLLDVVIGSQTSTSSGRLEFWRNELSGGVYSFNLRRRVTNAGIVMSVIAADFGGISRNDIAIGYRSNTSSYVGGTRIYFTDSGTLPLTGVDPSGGAIVNMVPAVTTADFNYGVKPFLPATPWLPDLAAGVKITATTGALVVFIR